MEVLTRPRSDFAARFAGVNLVVGTRLADDGVQVGGVVIHGLADGPGVVNGAAAATFSPRAVAVHREAPGGSPRNTVVVRVVGIERQGELVRVRGTASSGLRLAADITPSSVAGLGLGVGQEVTFVVKAAEVNIYAA